MKKNQENKKMIAVFGQDPVRRAWSETEEKWYFSVVDVIAILTASKNPQVYWRVLKKRLIKEGSGETVTKCNGLKIDLFSNNKKPAQAGADPGLVFC